MKPMFIAGIMLTLLLSSMSTPVINIQRIKSGNTAIVSEPDAYPTMQKATNSQNPESFLPIGINETLTSLSTEECLNFTYTLTRKMLVVIAMKPSIGTDYDLYVKWDGTHDFPDDGWPDWLPIFNETVCRPVLGTSFTERCPTTGERDLLPGTYYFQVRYYTGVGTFNLTLTGWPSFSVHNIDTGLNYTSIQEAIDAPETLEGHKIFVEEGTYNENVVVNKRISLIGQDRETTIIDGRGNYVAIDVRDYWNNVYIYGVNITGFTVRNASGYGIRIIGSDNCTISDNSVIGIKGYKAPSISVGSRNKLVQGCTISNNSVIDGSVGISIAGSNHVLEGNIATENLDSGLVLYGDGNWMVNRNHANGNFGGNGGFWIEALGGTWIVENNRATNNTVAGIMVKGTFDICTITHNVVEYNTGNAGVWLYESNGNILVTRNIIGGNGHGLPGWNRGGIIAVNSEGVITDNFIVNNTPYGIGLWETGHRKVVVYHNNFIDNTHHVGLVNSYNGIWDDGYPSGGNYWTDYNGMDLDHDGIGDTPYVIDANNIDYYPLMGMFSDFAVSLDDEAHHVTTVCSSAISDFQFDGSAILFNVTSEEGIGFCRVCIPHSLMSPPYTVIIDDGQIPVLYANYTLYDNGTHRMIYFAYGDLPLKELLSVDPRSRDLNGDGVVDVVDFVIIAIAYGSYPGHPRWNPRADLNDDEFIDINDLVLLMMAIEWFPRRTEHAVIIRSQPDTIPPNISVLSPENKTYPVSDIPLTFVVDEPTHWVGYSLDGQTNVTITGNTTLSDLEEGSHNVIVYANDTFGNMGSSERIFFTVAISPLEYNLTVYSSPGEVSFMVDGASHMTSWSGTYREGASVSLEMPEIHAVGDARYYWDTWSDGNTNRSRTVIMDTNITLAANYAGPYYELTVTSSPLTEVTFTINGTPQATPYTEWLLEASYTLEMPETYNGYVWSHWLEGGDTNRTKAVIMDKQIALTGVFAPVSPTATVNIHPETLNLKSKGRWITCYIELPEGYNVSDIDRATILLNGTIPVDQFWIDKPLESDGVIHLTVKFSRTAVSEFILSKGITHGNVTLTFTLELYDGSSFEDSDVIRVLLPSHTKT